jgi:hypothetical protein
MRRPNNRMDLTGTAAATRTAAPAGHAECSADQR